MKGKIYDNPWLSLDKIYTNFTYADFPDDTRTNNCLCNLNIVIEISTVSSCN